MARTYRRDSRGRFAGGGGGGGGGGGRGGSKAASTRAANTARAAALRAGGTTGIGGRVRAKGFAGGKGAQQRAGGLRTGGFAATVYTRVKGTGIGAGSRQGLRASAAAVGKARSKAAALVARGRQAKAAYKAAASAARQAKMIAGGRTTTRGLGKRTDAGAKSIRANVKAFQSAQAKVRKMERTRKALTRRRR